MQLNFWLTEMVLSQSAESELKAGASSQLAAALKETAASITPMSSMVKRSATNIISVAVITNRPVKRRVQPQD